MTSTTTTTMTRTLRLRLRLRLRRGQALHVALDAGTALQVTAGAVVLREPMRWLGESLVAPATALAEGQGHALTDGGWCVLEARGDNAVLLQHAPVSRWQGLWQRLRRPALA